MARVAGITAWTVAAVAWGTTAIAVVNGVPQVEPEAVDTPIQPVADAIVVNTEILAPVPAMPESGLVVLRYTPSEKPAPNVVVRRVTVAAPSTAGSQTTPAPAATKAPAPAPAKETSKGS